MIARVVPITATLSLDYCWCCHARQVAFEQHHVVPRHLGGENGPLVTLCGSCHTNCHTYATQLYKGKVTIDLSAYQGKASMPRLSYLAEVIRRATIAIEGTSGKKWKYATTFTDAEHDKLVRLAVLHGSQDKAIRAALDLLYGKECR